MRVLRQQKVIQIHLMFLFNQLLFNAREWNKSFKYISCFYLTNFYKLYDTRQQVFKYISCFYLTLTHFLLNPLNSLIQIHLMFLFNLSMPYLQVLAESFKYISCFYLTGQRSRDGYVKI